eukprot:4985099-Pyramimonas_sp.AAC.1
MIEGWSSGSTVSTFFKQSGSFKSSLLVPVWLSSFLCVTLTAAFTNDVSDYGVVSGRKLIHLDDSKDLLVFADLCVDVIEKKKRDGRPSGAQQRGGRSPTECCYS